MTDEQIFRRIEVLESKVTALEHSVSHVTDGIEEILDTLRGDGESPGVIGKIHVLWSSYIWVFCTGAALAGSFLTWIIMRLSENVHVLAQ